MMTPMAEDDDLLGNFFGTQKERYVVDHVLREVAADRPLDEILDDPYVKNRCTPQETARLLDRPELIRALGEDLVASAKQTLPSA
jgi:hypothetical protein